MSGAGEISDRPIVLTGGGIATIQAKGSGPINLVGTFTDIATATETLSLQGYNTDWNTIAGNLANNGGNSLVVTIGGATSGAATWVFDGNNTFTGGLTISSGELGLGSATAGGSGNLTFVGAALCLPRSRTSYACRHDQPGVRHHQRAGLSISSDPIH